VNSTIIITPFATVIIFLAFRTTYRALCSGRSVILAAGPQKAVPGVKVRFLDQISKRP